MLLLFLYYFYYMYCLLLVNLSYLFIITICLIHFYLKSFCLNFDTTFEYMYNVLHVWILIHFWFDSIRYYSYKQN